MSNASATDPQGEADLMPILFLSHAAPVLLMTEDEVMFGKPNTAHRESDVADWYRGLPQQLGFVGDNKPTAIVQVSAHYESTSNQKIKITAQQEYKSLLYDYYGFPDYTYDVQYPCPGNTQLAEDIHALLSQNDIPSELDFTRGIDHGGFVPLRLMFPDADIPVIQVSLRRDYDPSFHVKLGEALRPLRSRGVLLMGSGQMSHNMHGGNDVAGKSRVFVDAFSKGISAVPFAPSSSSPQRPQLSADERTTQHSTRLETSKNWRQLPYYRDAHTGPDHILPLLSCIGASIPDDDIYTVGDHWLLDMHSLRSFYIANHPPSSKDKQQHQVKDEL